jgi:predicted NBD/HSP70 family sugar kinase/biotin operon repressor
MTDNERLILRELANAPPLSKRDITQRCGIGWATAVKLITRLEEQGYVVSSGEARQNRAGKSATVYTLSASKPAAVGIDVEYGRTRVAIKNLLRQRLFESELATPAIDGPRSLENFLERQLLHARRKADELGISLDGGGIGVPNHLFGQEGVPYSTMAESLTSKLGFPVIVDNNVRCFSLAIAGPRAVHDSMLVVTVRSGIGVGIVMNRRIYKGERGCPGEIGHFSVEANGAPCRCGKRGCLETVVNRDALASSLEGLRRGDHAARKSLAHAAELLGQAIGNLMLVVDIRHVTIYAELCDLGPALLPPVRAAMLRTVTPGFDCDVAYETLDAEAYVAGAARLVLDEFVRT